MTIVKGGVLKDSYCELCSYENLEAAYTLAYPFALEKSGESFRIKYKELYAKDPVFSASFGHDMVMLIAKATDGKKLNSEEIIQGIAGLKQFDSLNGLLEIRPSGEINPPLYAVKIVNNTLIPVEEIQ